MSNQFAVHRGRRMLTARRKPGQSRLPVISQIRAIVPQLHASVSTGILVFRRAPTLVVPCSVLDEWA